MCHEVECGCHNQHHREERHQRSGCGCGHGYTQRRFFTREEMVARLEDYLKELQSETKGVEEQIAELRGKA